MSVRQLDVGGRVEYLTAAGELDLLVELEMNAAREPLMVQIGRRHHVVLPVDDLVDLAVVTEQRQILVRELGLRSNYDRHASTVGATPMECQSRVRLHFVHAYAAASSSAG